MKIFLITLTGLLALATLGNAQQKSIEQRVDSVLRIMTVEEKIGQLNQYSGKEATGPVNEKRLNLYAEIKNGHVGSMLNVKGVKDTREIQSLALRSRLKIPLLFGVDVIHGYKTVFPVPLAESCSWDLGLMQRTAHYAAREAAAAGVHWTFAPMVDISRDPRWGRVMEGAGEDTYLSSSIARTRVLGFQGAHLGGTDAVMACAKHFAAYGAVMAGRDYNDVDVSREQLWNIYLPPFKAALDAGVATFMNSFSTLDGIPATGSKYLQRDILKEGWKFKGFVVSDWGSIGEMIPWGYAADLKEAGLKAMLAGCDMDMESRAYKLHVEQLLKDKLIPAGLLDDAVRRILQKKFELGLFDDPYRFCNAEREQEVFSDPAAKVVAREAARRSIVLLKNSNNVLPLHKELRQIALIGPLVRSKRDMAGSWTVYADTADMISLQEGLHGKRLKTAFSYAKGCEINGENKNFEAALKAARTAEVVIMALGESWDMSGEAKSRTDISLPRLQMELFRAVKALGKPVVVVLMAGRPLIFNEIADKADAVVYAWWLGSEAGNALADVLYGDYNPSGKLTMTFPRNTGQIPLFYNARNTGKPVIDPQNIRYKSAYLDAPNTPQYAFGYGLSYTSFTYTDLKVDNTTMSPNDSITISFKLTNTGKMTGEEIVQLYINDPVASVTRPVMELRGFQKIQLRPGSHTTVTFCIKSETLAFYNHELQWITEPGTYHIIIGASSNDLKLKASIKLTDDQLKY